MICGIEIFFYFFFFSFDNELKRMSGTMWEEKFRDAKKKGNKMNFFFRLWEANFDYNPQLEGIRRNFVL